MPSLADAGFFARRFAAQIAISYLRLRNWVCGCIDKRRCFYAEYLTDRHIRSAFFPDLAKRGVMVEVGCATPELLSMSKHFRDCGWRCIGVEPNPRFVALHKQAGNEVYQYAAGDRNADNQDFIVVESSDHYSDHALSAHSYSSLGIKPEFEKYKGGSIRNFKQTHILVQIRTLNTILQTHCSDVHLIDFVAIDVEGYEIEVMKGFTPALYGNPIIVLENLFHSSSYTAYMETIGYRLHSALHYNYIYVPHSQQLSSAE
jgi:FkbM family methyltransferase